MNKPWFINFGGTRGTLQIVTIRYSIGTLPVKTPRFFSYHCRVYPTIPLVISHYTKYILFMVCIPLYPHPIRKRIIYIVPWYYTIRHSLHPFIPLAHWWYHSPRPPKISHPIHLQLKCDHLLKDAKSSSPSFASNPRRVVGWSGCVSCSVTGS